MVEKSKRISPLLTSASRNLVSDNPKFFFAIMGKDKYMERPIIADKDNT